MAARGGETDLLLDDPIEPAQPRVPREQSSLYVRVSRDPHGDKLRAAFKAASYREGIPPDVEEMARAFYERRGQPKRKHSTSQKSDDWIAKSDEGGIFGSVRKLFGRRLIAPARGRRSG